MDIPVLYAIGGTLAEAWENSMVALYKAGVDLSTEYDKEGDPPSKDATMVITVEDPFAEPMIHLDFPGGPADLQEYTMEVVEGIKDHWVRDPEDPDDTRWEYTYHNRLFAYHSHRKISNQIEYMAKKLSESPHSRRAQAITWQPWEDLDCYDPPCLQSLWARMIPDDSGVYWLNANVRFRSNDAYKAAFMNMFALVNLVDHLRDRIQELSGLEVKFGRYVHMADSYHLYGSYLEEFREKFLKSLERREFSDRTAHYSDWKDMMEEEREMILKKIADKDAR